MRGTRLVSTSIPKNEWSVGVLQVICKHSHSHHRTIDKVPELAKLNLERNSTCINMPSSKSRRSSEIPFSTQQPTTSNRPAVSPTRVNRRIHHDFPSRQSTIITRCSRSRATTVPQTRVIKRLTPAFCPEPPPYHTRITLNPNIRVHETGPVFWMTKQVTALQPLQM